MVVSRKLDELGRIVLPQEMRQKALIADGDMLDILQDEDGTIHIVAKQARCKLCGSRENLTPFQVGCVCGACVKEISKKA